MDRQPRHGLSLMDSSGGPVGGRVLWSKKVLDDGNNLPFIIRYRLGNVSVRCNGEINQ
jgi:hypothetical protein